MEYACHFRINKALFYVYFHPHVPEPGSLDNFDLIAAKFVATN